MADARAFWTERPGSGAIRGEVLREPTAGEVRVRATFSAISRGTESLVFRGKVPASQHDAMRCPFQDGDFPGPVKYGYASVGVVEAGPPDLLGLRVFCLHPHQDRYVVPIDAVHRVPDAVPSRRAVLAANLETAINGLWDGGPRLGDRIAVVGGGTVGGLVALLAARIPGVAVQIVDVAASRSVLAARIGATFASPEMATGDADMVFHASGTSAGLAASLGLAGVEATVVELSWYGDAPVTIPLGEAFHDRRLVLKSSQVGAVATPQRRRWSHARRLALALALLADPLFELFLSGESPFEDLPRIMPKLAASGAGDTLCHLVRYG